MASKKTDIFEVREGDNGFGFYASKDIEPKTVILVEEAAVVGPTAKDVCIECLRDPFPSSGLHQVLKESKFDEESITNKWIYRCHCCQTLCQNCAHFAPCRGHCGPEKGSGLSYHSNRECSIIQEIVRKKGFQESLFQILLPLRLVCLKETDRKLFDSLLRLESHVEQRLIKARDEPDESSISLIKIASILEEFIPNISIKEALRAVGVCYTNAFEIDIRGSLKGRVLLQNVSRINHSCLANLTHSMVVKESTNGSEETKNVNRISLMGNIIELTEETSTTICPMRTFLMEIQTQRPVKKGQELSIRYTSVFQGFLQRQEAFLKDWFFICTCQRCLDPTEFRTFTSATRCSLCSQGFVIPLQSGTCFKVVAQINEFEAKHHKRFFEVMALKRDFVEINLDFLHLNKDTLDRLIAHQAKYAKEVLEYLEILDPGSSEVKTSILKKFTRLS